MRGNVWTALGAAAMGVGRVGAAPRAGRWIQSGYRLGDPGRCLAIAIQGYKGLWGPGLRDGRLLLAGEEMGTGPPPTGSTDHRGRSQGRVVLLDRLPAEVLMSLLGWVSPCTILEHSAQISLVFTKKGISQ